MDNMKLYAKSEQDINLLIQDTDLQQGHWDVIHSREVWLDSNQERKSS